MISIGIDPGKKGGIAVISNQPNLKFVDAFEMPINSKGEIDSISLFEYFSTIKQNAKLEDPLTNFYCLIEKSQSMPGQGVKSTFSYGKGYGELLAILKILEIPFEEISPQKWKKEFNLIKKGKDESVNTAQNLFPNQSFTTDRGRLMDGKAEALLIAEYARRVYG